jgi:hypothetical protein
MAADVESAELDQVIVRLYTAFAARDAETMASCYHPDAHFSDPAFPDLNGGEVMAMWRALLGRSTDLRVTLGGHSASSDGGSPGNGTGRAHWTAVYTFGATGRSVTNEIDAGFRFEDGLIREHQDSFDFWRWSRQALGLPGLLLGWTPMLRSRVQRDAAKLLNTA